MIGYSFGWNYRYVWKPDRRTFFFFFCKNTFLIKMRQYLNKMRKFLKVMASNYSLSRQLTDSMAKTFPVEAGQLTQSLYFRWFWVVIMCYLVKFQWLVAFTILHFHWLFNCPSWPARLRAPANRTAFNSKISLFQARRWWWKVVQ